MTLEILLIEDADELEDISKAFLFSQLKDKKVYLTVYAVVNSYNSKSALRKLEKLVKRPKKDSTDDAIFQIIDDLAVIDSDLINRLRIENITTVDQLSISVRSRFVPLLDE